MNVDVELEDGTVLLDVELMRRDFAIVHVSVRWWASLFTFREVDERYAISLPAIDGGVRWYYDKTSKRVEPAVQAALERATAEFERSEVRGVSSRT